MKVERVGGVGKVPSAAAILHGGESRCFAVHRREAFVKLHLAKYRVIRKEGTLRKRPRALRDSLAAAFLTADTRPQLLDKLLAEYRRNDMLPAVGLNRYPSERQCGAATKCRSSLDTKYLMVGNLVADHAAANRQGVLEKRVPTGDDENACRDQNCRSGQEHARCIGSAPIENEDDADGRCDDDG
ncbi:hypothetical protein CA85_34820 [Allorhodopirellula solitaria]|uniref:Uncharacterized protein n=1 Tax=Allorhodopirellula solitaria TaxID=2527987 RepID=A0A5C5XT03_9BACT|nr:hypothetical protein CA85_34820 [Allorhodopirellula solitaria]